MAVSKIRSPYFREEIRERKAFGLEVAAALREISLPEIGESVEVASQSPGERPSGLVA